MAAAGAVKTLFLQFTVHFTQAQNAVDVTCKRTDQYSDRDSYEEYEGHQISATRANVHFTS